MSSPNFSEKIKNFFQGIFPDSNKSNSPYIVKSLQKAASNNSIEVTVCGIISDEKGFTEKPLDGTRRKVSKLTDGQKADLLPDEQVIRDARRLDYISVRNIQYNLRNSESILKNQSSRYRNPHRNKIISDHKNEILSNQTRIDDTLPNQHKTITFAEMVKVHEIDKNNYEDDNLVQENKSISPEQDQDGWARDYTAYNAYNDNERDTQIYRC